MPGQAATQNPTDTSKAQNFFNLEATFGEESEPLSLKNVHHQKSWKKNKLRRWIGQWLEKNPEISQTLHHQDQETLDHTAKILASHIEEQYFYEEPPSSKPIKKHHQKNIVQILQEIQKVILLNHLQTPQDPKENPQENGLSPTLLHALTQKAKESLKQFKTSKALVKQLEKQMNHQNLWLASHHIDQTRKRIAQHMDQLLSAIGLSPFSESKLEEQPSLPIDGQTPKKEIDQYFTNALSQLKALVKRFYTTVYRLNQGCSSKNTSMPSYLEQEAQEDISEILSSILGLVRPFWEKKDSQYIQQLCLLSALELGLMAPGSAEEMNKRFSMLVENDEPSLDHIKVGLYPMGYHNIQLWKEKLYTLLCTLKAHLNQKDQKDIEMLVSFPERYMDLLGQWRSFLDEKLKIKEKEKEDQNFYIWQSIKNHDLFSQTFSENNLSSFIQEIGQLYTQLIQ